MNKNRIIFSALVFSSWATSMLITSLFPTELGISVSLMLSLALGIRAYVVIGRNTRLSSRPVLMSIATCPVAFFPWSATGLVYLADTGGAASVGVLIYLAIAVTLGARLILMMRAGVIGPRRTALS